VWMFDGPRRSLGRNRLWVFSMFPVSVDVVFCFKRAIFCFKNNLDPDDGIFLSNKFPKKELCASTSVQIVKTIHVSSQF
jgi:hypothetical protein